MHRYVNVTLRSLCLAAFMHAGSAWAETIDLTLLLVNDIDQMSENGEGRGGYARLAGAVEAERQDKDNVLFIHAGDTISPSLLSGFDQGEHIITLLNMIRPDVFVPGNHEFDFGPDVFRTRMGEATFPRLAANLRGPDGALLAGFEDTKIFQVDGLRIGVVGLTAEDASVKSSPGDLKFTSLVETATDQAEALRSAGADLVVAVAHAGRATDRQLFASGAFDVILSGDDHDLMVLYDGRTAMAESFSQGEYVTAIDLTIDFQAEGDERKVSWRPNFRLIDSATVEPDPDVLKQVQTFEADLSAELDVGLGKTDTELDSRRATVRTGEAAIGNLIADAMRAAAEADVALMNGGGIRADKVYPVGTEISRRDILSELPFGNRIVKLEVDGATIKAALEHGFGAVEDGAGRFPQIAGMEVEADLNRPAGERVTAVTIGGNPLDPAAKYTLATVDFIARGGDGYAMFAEAPQLIGERDGGLIASVVMAEIRKAGTISPTVDGRIAISR